MTSLKNKEHILEAIDQLRRRKARPDINRICNYLFRKYSVNFPEARADLQCCVDNGAVLKVEYKGSTSYRNASKKFSHLKRGSSDDNSAPDIRRVNRKFSQLLTNAFGELIVEEPDYLEFGVPHEVIVSNILSKDSVRYTQKYVNILLEKEVDSGSLIKMENGNYQMGPENEEGRKIDECNRDSSDLALSISNIESDNDCSKVFPTIHLKPKKKQVPKTSFKTKLNESSENSMDSDEKKSEMGLVSRTGGRQKRAKKVFDPSDSHLPKKRGRPAGSLNRATLEKQLTKSVEEPRPDSRTSSNGRDQGGVCSVCHLQNKKGPNERMVSCRECSNKAHQSCLKGDDDMMLKMYPDNTWQCPHCKTCVICYETSDAGRLNVCSVCADGYHSTCHQPVITEKPKNGTKWLCINCQMPEELEVYEIESNIGNSYKIIRNDQSPPRSGSGNSTPTNYNSSHSSPMAPHLSPQRSSNASRPQRSPSPTISDSQSKDSDFEENIDPSIPDATHWTYEEVYQYFAQYFPEEAAVFRDQEIDGRSLLLLKRLDVLTNLKLKLGPALKIYRHVVKLQVRRDDPKLYLL